MSVIRNSVRAFAFALIPLALLHASLMASGLAGLVAEGARWPVPDHALSVFMTRFGLDAALLWLGHTRLRALGLYGRGAYGVMGGFAAAIGYMVAYRFGIALASPIPGTTLTAAVLPVATGMLCGFLYAQFARREVIDGEQDLDPKPVGAAAEPAIDLATYDGPVQVRTSLAATAIAAAVPALAISFPVVAALLTFMPSGSEFDTAAVRLAMPAQMIISTLFVLFVPSAIVAGATHALARSFRLTTGPAYALVGAAIGAVGALPLLVLLNGVLFTASIGMVCGALMGAVYRRFAGLEPLALPEDVIAEDYSALVPEDHPSRRTRAVILNG